MNYTHNQYLYGCEYEEACPNCGAGWYGECPDDPWWVEYTCETCGYRIGSYYDQEYQVLDEGDPAKQRAI